jgi:Tol biopolymer transport system component
MQRLLAFMVESVLTEQPGRLKETVIGIEVFDRAPDYDCKQDPVVRVEMRRLRSKLREYYGTEGQSDEVVIGVEKGSYVPSLIKRASQSNAFDSPPSDSEAVPPAPALVLHTLAEPAPVILLPTRTVTPRARRVWLMIVTAALLMATVLVTVLSRWSKPSRPLRLFPLTGNAGLEMNPAFSPDGKQVAYSWDGNRRNFDIYVKPVEGGAPRRLTDNAAHDVHPTWSPDGQRIAFLRVLPEKSELLVVPAAGGLETVITTVVTRANHWHSDQPVGAAEGGPVWSPDGSYFLLVSDIWESSSQVRIVKIYRGGRQEPLTSPPLGSSDVNPTVSPSGAWVAFLRIESAGSTDIYLMPSRGGPLTRLTFDSRDISGLTWLDENNLLYSSNRGGNLRLWQISRGGGEAQPVPAGGAQPQWPAVSPGGHWLAFVDLLNDVNIWRLPLRDEGASDRAEPFLASAGSDHSPAESPDGKTIAFVSNRSGTWQIWLSDSDGTNVRQLMDFKGSALGTPRWSPDGRRLVFDGQLQNHSSIWLIDRDGSNLHRLNNSAVREYMPSWSRDGQWIYFCSLRDGQDRLWKQRPDSGQAIALTKDWLFDATESSDGQTLYMQRGVRGSIWQMPVQGGTPRPVPELIGMEPVRYWTMAGDKLYFVRQEQPPRELLSLNLVTRKLTPVATIPNELMAGTPGLSVDLTRHWLFFVQKYQHRSSIMLQER